MRLLEQEKVEKEERRKEKRRRREEEAEREAEEKQAAEDREKLRAWQESQLHEQRHTTSEQIISEVSHGRSVVVMPTEHRHVATDTGTKTNTDLTTDL